MELEQSMPRWLVRQPRMRWDVLLKDLRLFASVCLAQLIVRRTLRRQRQERAERLKRIKLAPPAGDEIFKRNVCA